MAAPVPLRDDFDAAALRGLAKASRDPGQFRRLLSLAEIYDGGTRGAAAKTAGPPDRIRQTLSVLIVSEMFLRAISRRSAQLNITMPYISQPSSSTLRSL